MAAIPKGHWGTNMSDRVKEKPRVEERPVPAKEQVAPKQQPSPFDQVLEQSRVIQKQIVEGHFLPRVTDESSTSKEKERQSSDDDDKKSDRDKETDREREEGGSTTTSREEKGKSGGSQRVTAKATIKQRGGQSPGSGMGGSGRGFDRRIEKDFEAKDKPEPKGLRLGDARLLAEAKVLAARENLTTQEMQKIIDRLVQAFRVGLNRKGEDEVQIDLSREMFEGLNMTLTAGADGAVTVLFKTAGGNVRRLFEKERERIGKALTERGIKVAEIIVS